MWFVFWAISISLLVGCGSEYASDPVGSMSTDAVVEYVEVENAEVAAVTADLEAESDQASSSTLR